MTLVRPEVQSLLMRWSEVLAGLAVGILGVWFATRIGVFWQVLGGIIVLIGLGLAFAGWRRIGFASTRTGPGLVEVDERQISYFAAYEGGVISIDQLARVSAIAPAKGGGPDDLLWVLEEDGGVTLSIPNAASGAQLLFDAFAALPDVNYSNAQKALASRGSDSFVIWTKPLDALH